MPTLYVLTSLPHAKAYILLLIKELQFSVHILCFYTDLKF